MSVSAYTTKAYSGGKVDEASLPGIHANLQHAFQAGITRPESWRRKQLQALQKAMTENKRQIIDAVKADLGKQFDQEVLVTEYNMPLAELEDTLHHLHSWMQPDGVGSNLAALPASSYVYKDPLGVVCIMAPWNYPVNLAVVPLIGAIAAGNAVFLKFSRHSAKTGATMAEILPRYLDTRAIVIEGEGGAPFITATLKLKWDHIFFTGSVSVGKIVYEAAAKNLTPVTLELGGKNPCIVDKTANVDLSAKRIAWGALFNCGQTCIRPDWLLVHKDVEEAFTKALVKYIEQFFGKEPKNSTSFARVISTAAAKRLQNLFGMGEVVVGGVADVENRYIAPTVIRNPKMDSELMTDEIFGPIIPIVSVSSVDEAIKLINERPLPLSLYVFSSSTSVQDKVLSSTRSGAALCNDCLLHFTNTDLPFGGVGHSGLGAYHGKLSFETFVHRRAVVKQWTQAAFDVPLRYPPYTPFTEKLIDTATNGSIGKILSRGAYLAVAGAVAWFAFNAKRFGF